MSPNLSIAWRFLTAKKRAMAMSLACTVLGVGLFIVTQATTSGFEAFFIKAILGADGAIRIEDRFRDTSRAGELEGRRFVEGVEEPRLVIEALKLFPNVRGASMVLRANVTVNGSTSAQIFGIETEEHAKVSDLSRHVTVGTLQQFAESPGGALIGKELAERLRVGVGDWLLVEARTGVRRFRVSALYETGVSDIDKVRIFVHLTEARSLLARPSGATFIQVGLFDPSRAVEEAARMEETLGHSARPWQRRERVWIGVFQALGISSGITVTVFTLIAGLAMFNTLAMVVLEKTKDIGILRSMGYERRDITVIFLWQAGIVLMIGSVLGCAFGALATWGVSHVPLELRGILVTKTYVIAWSPWHYAAAVGTAFVMIMTASFFPARRAARLEPGDIVRGTAT